MDYIIIIIGTLSIMIGLLLWTSPQTLIKAGEVLNKEVDADHYIEKKRVFFGVLLIVLGNLAIWFLYLR